MTVYNKRQPTVSISNNAVVLIYLRNGLLYKQIFPYGATSWEDATLLVGGNHPGLVDQYGKLWLVWQQAAVIYWAISADGGRNFTSPIAIIHSGILPAVDILPNGFAAIAFAQPLGKNIVLVTEGDSFVGITSIASYIEELTHVTICAHGKQSRVLVGWVEGETAKYSFSDDNGITWSSVYTLGTYTGLDFLDLPTGHLMAVVEHHHRLWGMISRDHGLTWDEPFLFWLPEAAIEPALLLDIYDDVVVFSSEWDVSIPGQHRYVIRVRDLPFYAYASEILDTSGMQYLSSEFSE
jgi:hypothetical protein